MIQYFKKFRNYAQNMHDPILRGGVWYHLWLIFDYLLAFVRHGASITNYFVYQFYGLRNNRKAEYVTWRRQRWIYKQCNDPNYTAYVKDKDKINETFSPFLKRAWLVARDVDFDEFVNFAKTHRFIFCKPAEGTEGFGIREIDAQQLTEKEWTDLYRELKEGHYIVEEKIVQHDVLRALHPSSVNTVRVSTVRNQDGVQIMTAVLRIGRHGMHYDNYTTGGIVSAIDIASGIVKVPAVSKQNESFVFHPETGSQIVGIGIPFWQDVISLAKQLGEVVPQVRYTGWDIAITPTGPVLIEGNYQGNFHIQQHSDRRGVFHLYKKAIERI